MYIQRTWQRQCNCTNNPIKDKGKKNKKKNRKEGNANENNGSEEATTETNNANNDSNQTGESRTTVTAHMHQEDDEELNDK